MVLLASCAGMKASQPGPAPTPERPPLVTDPDSGGSDPSPPSIRQPAAPPSMARLRGWLPLAATGVPGFLAAHPAWDGRGVLIGILDSGIDAGVPGFDSTSAGRPKLLDLRDFSGEGHLPLRPVTPSGDSIVVAGRVLRGFGRVRALAAGGPWYAGVVRERTLGPLPASDVNDNGSDGDTLVVIVARASDGWVLLADTDGNGSLAGEPAVHDYLVARETFGWHRRGQRPPLTIAVNFSETGAGPRLDLVFDTSAHGTHVAGIAAARGIGGEKGFNGVAPGAQLLGLKISRNDFGGLTTTGSVLAALDYAIRFARARGMPLVANMSFGVGNEREGSARLDALLDSVLLANPDVVFVTSAGNDGPGLSTMGFPGSARRALTVGATEPWVLSAAAAAGGRPAADVLLYFSSRGGETGKPDVVAPGIAYATVPRWEMGEEFKGGTSMASPQVAGLAAILLSAALEQRRAVTAFDVRRALTGSAIPVPGESPVDAGAGVPELETAWDILRGPAPAAEFDVEWLGQAGATAAFRIGPAPEDTLVRFRVSRLRGTEPLQLLLVSNTPWLKAAGSITLRGPSDTITLLQHPPRGAGAYSGAVRASAAGVRGPLFSLVSTVVIPFATRAVPVRANGKLLPGGLQRVFFAADSGRPFRVRTATATAAEHLVAALHQPGGAPNLGENGLPGGPDTAAAVYQVEGRDVVAGFYEAVAVAANERTVAASVEVDHAPIAVRLVPGRGDSLAIEVTSLEDSALAGRLDLGLIGGEHSVVLAGTGGDDVTASFLLPGWTRRVVLDLELDPAQWPRFTDFGFTVLDGAGRILGKSPANYARTRLIAELPVGAADQQATIVLSPGFAEPGSREGWKGRVTVRLEADRPTAISTAGGDEFHLAGRGAAVFRGRLGELPWILPQGFEPLAILIAESAGVSWHWQLVVRGSR
jgi:subtilisin family serine protease